MSFENLKLIEPILKALKTEGYTQPTPIQAQAIPIILQQRDLLGCAQTGTGKTAAFAIPTLQLLHNDRQNHKEQKTIKALVLTPTRELAIQIDESFAAYGKHTGLKHAVIFGGVSQNPQVDKLRRGVDILVATPGRLLDLMQQRLIHLDHVKILILDEADRMLDMGFVNDVKKIIAKVPQKRQTLFFSATMPKEIQHLADSILYKPERVEVTPVSSTADTIQQEIFFVAKGDKKQLLNHILKDKDIATVLVFTRTKHGADKVVKDLNRAGITAEAIHGNKSQNARQRALTNFKARTTRVLVATDIAARGIDIDELTHVINYELPNVPETYVHRIGRTGRAGASGIAMSFCDEEEKEFLKDIHKLIGKTIPVNEAHPYPLPQLTSQQKILNNLKKDPQVRNFKSSSERRNENKRRDNRNRGKKHGKGGPSGMSGSKPGAKRG
ncbi:DEAD/DEAH box helicase [Mucilaginibacter limnophilus]|uniref:DEAD-box ATP-dependent RNA helicase RhpA n=1 Tax=Mucilaginibacter limnophilus TaxID=1932778 RepID=A0A3S2V0V5_9SPHI|nr:DEAD/DEAH box helicase [Mucilaginibacter limnophilus]RVU00181.1 DEAD/DEAH box helicase [Mucilaginibacter limnophilus]